jgi:pimeloyl-ACP methyl ester carboxylesterase
MRSLPAARGTHELTALEPSAVAHPPAIAVVYLPGRWGNARLWAADEPRRDLRVALADAGFPSLTVSYACSTAARGDLPIDRVAAIRTEHLLEDVWDAVAVARDSFGISAVAVCGFSMGATLGFLAASGAGVTALVALDGGLPPTTTRPLSVGGCLDNPYLHPRHVHAALGQIASGGAGPARDELRWRLVQDPLWPAAQVEEVRCGIDASGVRLLDRVAGVTCPILCVGTDARDPADDLRAARTADATRAGWVRRAYLPGWRHEEVTTRARNQDSGLLDEIRRFLEDVA